MDNRSTTAAAGPPASNTRSNVRVAPAGVSDAGKISENFIAAEPSANQEPDVRRVVSEEDELLEDDLEGGEQGVGNDGQDKRAKTQAKGKAKASVGGRRAPAVSVAGSNKGQPRASGSGANRNPARHGVQARVTPAEDARDIADNGALEGAEDGQQVEEGQPDEEQEVVEWAVNLGEFVIQKIREMQEDGVDIPFGSRAALKIAERTMKAIAEDETDEEGMEEVEKAMEGRKIWPVNTQEEQEFRQEDGPANTQGEKRRGEEFNNGRRVRRKESEGETPRAARVEDAASIITKRTFNLEQEEEDVPSNVRKPSNAYNNMFHDGRTLPTYLFDAEVIKRVNASPAKFIKQEPSLQNGKKIQVVLVEHADLVPKTVLSVSRWTAAARARLEWLGAPDHQGHIKVTPDVLERWGKELKMVVEHEDWAEEKVDFVAAAASFHDTRFNIYFFQSPFIFDKHDWETRLNRFLLMQAKGEVKCVPGFTGVDDLAPKAKVAVDTAQRARTAGFGGGDGSFRSGLTTASSGRGTVGFARTQRPCVACGRAHYANNCTETHTVRGDKVIAKWVGRDKHLIDVRNPEGANRNAPSRFCYAYTITGRCTDEHARNIAHACSICGTNGHAGTRCSAA